MSVATALVLLAVLFGLVGLLAEGLLWLAGAGLALLLLGAALGLRNARSR